MSERNNRYGRYGQYDPDESSRYYDRNRPLQRDSGPMGWEVGSYEPNDERRYEGHTPDRRGRPAGHFEHWQEARDRDRDRDQRERGYGSGVSGEYWTRQAATRPEFRALGIGGLQQGGFSSYAGMEPDPLESRHPSGGYYGRGPKGYTRTDERIREDASERLFTDEHVDATEISVIVQDGEVTLVGSVETRRQKHRAENLVDAVSGVRDVHNQLRVTRGGVMSQIAEKVHQGVDRLTGHEPRREAGSPNPGAPNSRNAS
jgi:hypothetical protein